MRLRAVERRGTEITCLSMGQCVPGLVELNKNCAQLPPVSPPLQSQIPVRVSLGEWDCLITNAAFQFAAQDQKGDWIIMVSLCPREADQIWLIAQRPTCSRLKAQSRLQGFRIQSANQVARATSPIQTLADVYRLNSMCYKPIMLYRTNNQSEGSQKYAC